MASAAPTADAFVRTAMPSCSVGSRLTVVSGARPEVAGVVPRGPAERVVAHVPAEAIEGGPPGGRRGRAHHSGRQVGPSQRLGVDDLLAVEGAVRELEPHPLGEVTRGGADATGRGDAGVVVERVLGRPSRHRSARAWSPCCPPSRSRRSVSWSRSFRAAGRAPGPRDPPSRLPRPFAAAKAPAAEPKFVYAEPLSERVRGA